MNIRNGNKEKPLPDNNSVAISSSLASTIFGNSDPMGKPLIIEHRKEFIVTAVYDDLPVSSSIQAQALITWENVEISRENTETGSSIQGFFSCLTKK